MARLFRCLLTVGMAFLLSTPPAYAFWKDKVTVNEKNAAEYIDTLRSGANPMSLHRPKMRFVKEYQGKQEQKRLNQAMDEAEGLARAGKPELIPELELRYQDLRKNPGVQE